MKKLVISLLKRTDRKRNFQKNNLEDYVWVDAIDGSQQIFRDCRSAPGWKNPYNGRPLLQNEVACFLSHAKAWKIAAQSKQPVIIMEDDAVVNDYIWDEEFYEEVIRSDYCDFLYLQRNENEPMDVGGCPEPLHKDLNRFKQRPALEVPSFPYNLTAYCITPETARYLLLKMDKKNMMPVDDFVPGLFKDPSFKPLALVEDSCNQVSRDSWSDTDIERSPEFKNFKIHILTVGDKEELCNKLNTSARKFDITIKNLGLNKKWRGTDMSGPGGGQKVNLLKEYIQDLPNEDLILFTDAFDVFYADDINTIYERYRDLSAKVIFGAELYCWPQEDLADAHPPSKTPYRYLNSGNFMGTVQELKRMLRYNQIKDDEDDQLFFQNIFITNTSRIKIGDENAFDIRLDYECYLFQTHDEDVEILNGQLHNPKTLCCPCIYHGNGGDDAKVKFNSLYDQLFPADGSMFIPNNNKFEILAPDMLLIDFMTQSQCEDLIDLADKHGGWGSLEYDKFPAQEIRMKELGMWEELEKAWNQYIVPVCEHYWQPLQMYGLRDGFVMRYAMDTQTNLNLHHDASLVTGSVKLNDSYKGAELVYPRQNITNKDIPVGKMILFPGQVTHGHECLPLKDGVKYSLTIWTCRYVNDTI